MRLFFPKIKIILLILIFLSLIALSLNFVGLKNGMWKIILYSVVPILDILLFFALFAILKKVNHQSYNKEKQYRQLLDLSPEAIFVHRKGSIVYSNEAGAKLLGYNDAEELLNRPWRGILDDKSYRNLKSSSNQFKSDQQFKNHRLKFYRVDGGVRYVEAKSTFIEFDGEPAREVIARDITDQENNQKMLEKFSYLDPLTQLPNRRSILNQFDHMINESEQFGIMFIDLDKFKKINDTYGHGEGDLLLKQMSEHLKFCIRKEDVVGRYGGDEFIILLPGATDYDCRLIAEKIIDDDTMSLFLSSCDIQVTLSIGISLYPINGDHVDSLVRKADEAMYQAKKLGENNYLLSDSVTSNK